MGVGDLVCLLVDCCVEVDVGFEVFGWCVVCEYDIGEVFCVIGCEL